MSQVIEGDYDVRLHVDWNVGRVVVPHLWLFTPGDVIEVFWDYDRDPSPVEITADAPEAQHTFEPGVYRVLVRRPADQQLFLDAPSVVFENLPPTPAPPPWAPPPEPGPPGEFELRWGSYNDWRFGEGTPFAIRSVDGLADMMALKTQDAELVGDGEVFGDDWERKRVLTVELDAAMAQLARCWPDAWGQGDPLGRARCACMRRQSDLPLSINDRWVVMARPRRFVVPQRRAEMPTVSVSFEAQDPALYGAEERSASVTLQLAGEGRRYPRPSASPGLTPGSWRYPRAGSSGLLEVQNEGCRRTFLRLRITGPVLNPIVINQRSFERLQFNLALSAGEVLDVDMRRGEVWLNGTASRYYRLSMDSSWWSCEPGSTPVRFASAGGGATSARLTVWWRSAW